jgi:hypothetical protein
MIVAEFCIADQARNDLCLSGGFCNITTLSCECPAGYGADNTLAHQGNCALPDSILLWFFIYFAIASTFSITGLLYYNFRTTTWRWLTTNQLLAVTTSLISVLGIYLQNGMFEFGLVFFNILISTMHFVGSRLAYEFTKPMLAALGEDSRPLRRRFFIFFIVFHVFLLMVTTSLLVTCRDVEPYRYNVSSTCWSVVMLSASTIHVMSILATMRRLNKSLLIASTSVIVSDVAKFQKMNFFIVRSKSIMLVAKLYLFAIAVSQLPCILLYICLRTVPYGYIFLFLVVHCSIITSFGTLLVVRRSIRSSPIVEFNNSSITPKELNYASDRPIVAMNSN